MRYRALMEIRLPDGVVKRGEHVSAKRAATWPPHVLQAMVSPRVRYLEIVDDEAPAVTAQKANR